MFNMCSNLACNNTENLAERAPTFKRCGRCRINSYCCKTCQEVDWKRHQASCHERSKNSKKVQKRLDLVVAELNRNGSLRDEVVKCSFNGPVVYVQCYKGSCGLGTMTTEEFFLDDGFQPFHRNLLDFEFDGFIPVLVTAKVADTLDKSPRVGVFMKMRRIYEPPAVVRSVLDFSQGPGECSEEELRKLWARNVKYHLRRNGFSPIPQNIIANLTLCMNGEPGAVNMRIKCPNGLHVCF